MCYFNYLQWVDAKNRFIVRERLRSAIRSDESNQGDKGLAW